jgi:hypothetical protein
MKGDRPIQAIRCFETQVCILWLRTTFAVNWRKLSKLPMASIQTTAMWAHYPLMATVVAHISPKQPEFIH